MSEWTFRTNRAFGALNEGEMVTFEDGDLAMQSLVGTGYMDLVSGPQMPGIASEEKLHEPTLTQAAPKKSTKKKETTNE